MPQVLVTYGPERGSWAPKYLGIHGDGSSTSDEWRLGNAGHEPCEVDESLRRLAWETAQDGELVLTFTDSNYVDLALSWALRARRVGVNNTIIGVLDVESEEVGWRGWAGAGCWSAAQACDLHRAPGPCRLWL